MVKQSQGKEWKEQYFLGSCDVCQVYCFKLTNVDFEQCRKRREGQGLGFLSLPYLLASSAVSSWRSSQRTTKHLCLGLQAARRLVNVPGTNHVCQEKNARRWPGHVNSEGCPWDCGFGPQHATTLEALWPDEACDGPRANWKPRPPLALCHLLCVWLIRGRSSRLALC